MQINSGFMRVMTDTVAVPHLIYENTCVNLMCWAGVYDTSMPQLTLNKDWTNVQRSKVATLHYYQRPMGFVLADIYRKSEAHTPSIFPTKPIMESVSIPQESNKQSSGVLVEVGWNPQRSAALGLGEYVDYINSE